MKKKHEINSFVFWKSNSRPWRSFVKKIFWLGIKGFRSESIGISY